MIAEDKVCSTSIEECRLTFISRDLLVELPLVQVINACINPFVSWQFSPNHTLTKLHSQQSFCVWVCVCDKIIIAIISFSTA